LTFAFHFTTFETKLTQSLNLWGEIYDKKKSYILHLQDKKTGNIYLGELNNFQSLHKINLKTAKNKLENALTIIKNKEAQLQMFDPTKAGLNLFPHNISEFEKLPPSALFCLETALLEMVKYKAPSSFFSKGMKKSCALLIPQENQDLNEQLQLWLKNQVTHVKIKIGRALELERETLNFLLSDCSQHNIQYRLDGNQQMSLTALNKLLEAIPLQNIQFFEEPLKEINEWEIFYSKFQRPLALDESFLERKNHPPVGTKYVIIKPSITHSVSGCSKLISENKFKVIISSAFESSIGMGALKFLASQTNESPGLDTLKYLQKDY